MAPGPTGHMRRLPVHLAIEFGRTGRYVAMLVVLLLLTGMVWHFVLGQPWMPAAPRVVALAWGREPESLNPLWARNLGQWDWRPLLFDALVRLDGSGRPLPNLATGWQPDDSLTRWRFALRPGVRWHDGQPLTADDVVFTINTIADYWCPALGWEDWRGVRAVPIGDFRVEIVLPDPDPVLPFRLSEVYILPKHRLEGLPVKEWQRGAFALAPVGTGPFRFDHWVRGERLELHRNADYHGGQPALGGIRLCFHPREMAAGSCHAYLLTDGRHEVPDGFRATVYAGPVGYHVVFGAKSGLFESPSVRRAWAVLCQEAATRAHPGIIPSSSLFPPGSWLDELAEQMPRGEELAVEALMSEGGWRQGRGGVWQRDDQPFAVDLEVLPAGDLTWELAELCVERLRDAGFEVSARRVSWQRWWDIATGREGFDVVLGWWPDSPYGHLFVADVAVYRSSAWDELCQQLEGMWELPARAGQLKEFTEWFVQEGWPWVPLGWQARTLVHAPELQGIEPGPFGWLWNVGRWWWGAGR